MFSQTLLVSFFLLVSAVFSQNCGTNVNLTSKLMDTVVVFSNSSVYRIVVPTNGTKALSGKAALLPANETSCPAGCTYELLSYSSPKNDSILHVRGHPYPLIVPPGYKNEREKSPLSCARLNGNCGASVPIYRHYKFTSSGGLVHAYSYDQSSIPGFVREFAPICFGWTSPSKPDNTTTTVGRDKRSDEIEKKTTVLPSTPIAMKKGSLVWLGDEAMWLFPNGSLTNITIG